MADFTAHTTSFWDDRYGTDGFVYGEAPNDYLAAQRHRLRPGMKALVPGDGEGRNGVWLAEQGLDVMTIDLSELGVRKAHQLAARRNVSITAVQADLTRWTWPTAQFDVVAAIFLHLPPTVRPQIHRAMLAALRPGGVIVIEAFRPAQLHYREAYGSSGGPPMEEMLFSEAMLRDDFDGAEVLELTSAEADMDEGNAHRGLSAVVRGVFRRNEPGDPSV